MAQVGRRGPQFLAGGGLPRRRREVGQLQSRLVEHPRPVAQGAVVFRRAVGFVLQAAV